MTGIISMFQSAIRLMLPLLFAALGTELAARVGIIYMSMEGAMLSSAFVAVYVAMATGSAWLGQLAAVMFGMVYSVALAFFIIKCRGNHVVCSLGFNFIALGATTVLMSSVFGGMGYSPPVGKVPLFELPLFGQQSVNFFLAILLTAGVIFLLRKTNVGLRIYAIGENTAAADSLGIRVEQYKYLVMLIAGALAGLGGSELTLGQMGYFARNITSSMGYLAYSAVVFAGFNPIGIIATTFILGFFNALQMRAQTFLSVPGEFLLTIPYVVTIIALVLSKKQASLRCLAKFTSGTRLNHVLKLGGKHEI